VIEYPNLGNEAAGIKTSDLVFKVKEIPHAQFKRKENDLVYSAKYSLLQALTSEPVILTTLDGRKLYVPLDEVISPKSVKLVKGEGMPIYNKDEFKVEHFGKPQQKGDLFIKFEIKFPNFISDEDK